MARGLCSGADAEGAPASGGWDFPAEENKGRSHPGGFAASEESVRSFLYPGADRRVINGVRGDEVKPGLCSTPLRSVGGEE